MNSMLTIKLRRDLRATWSRFVLMVVAMTVSLTVFGAVLTAWAASGRETSTAYISTEPASATILLDQAIDAAGLSAIAAEVRLRPGILQATARTQFNSQVEVNGQARAIPLQVFVALPDDPMRIARFDVQRDGRWPPSPGQIFVGGDSLGLLGSACRD
jgi:putative ABC transport system permease protein